MDDVPNIITFGSAKNLNIKDFRSEGGVPIWRAIEKLYMFRMVRCLQKSLVYEFIEAPVFKFVYAPMSEFRGD